MTKAQEAELNRLQARQFARRRHQMAKDLVTRGVVTFEVMSSVVFVHYNGYEVAFLYRYTDSKQTRREKVDQIWRMIGADQIWRMIGGDRKFLCQHRKFLTSIT